MSAAMCVRRLCDGPAEPEDSAVPPWRAPCSRFLSRPVSLSAMDCKFSSRLDTWDTVTSAPVRSRFDVPASGVSRSAALFCFFVHHS
mmetsp:Transcript_25004/g.71865  ORF Transcript_25004/g.71865 Transcript_25004/m.71865 type:complete len:87 (+) Transcript_25004:1241-1501(+)